MNEDAIRIRVDFINRKDAESFLAQLKKSVTDENLRHIKIRSDVVNRNETLQFIETLKHEINRLSASKIAVGFDLREAENNLRRLQAELRTLQAGTDAFIQKQMEVRDASRTVADLSDQYKRLSDYIRLVGIAQREANAGSYAMNHLRQQLDMRRQEKQAEEEAARATAQARQRAVDAINRALQARKQDADAAVEASRRIEEAERRQAEATEEATRAMVSAWSERTSALSQMLGGIVQFSDVFKDSLSGVNSLFDFGIVRQGITFFRSAVLQATGGAFEDIVSRYDIMTTFESYMNAIGVSSERAEEALDRVDQSIRGIPIGLDESAQRLRRYQMFLGDLNKATNLTIGLQSAIFAGGASDQMRRTALYEIDRLLSAGKLNTARQWNALLQGLGVSVRYIAKELDAPTKALPEMLATGEIAAQDFLKALMSLGEGTSEASQELQELLNIYKGTLESWLSNISYSVRRGGERIGRALNESLVMSTDRSIINYLQAVRDAIDSASLASSDYIRRNSDQIGQLIDGLEGLADAAGRLDFSNIADGSISYLLEGVQGLTDVMNALPADKVEQFLSYVMTLSVPMEKLLQMASGGTAVQVGVVRRFMDLDQAELIERVAHNMGIIEEATYNILSLIPDKKLSDFIGDVTVFGRPVINTLSKIIELLGWIQIASGGALSKAAIPRLQGIGGALGGLTAGVQAMLPWGAVAGGVGAFSLMGSLYKFLDVNSQRKLDTQTLQYFERNFGEFNLRDTNGTLAVSQGEAERMYRMYSDYIRNMENLMHERRRLMREGDMPLYDEAGGILNAVISPEEITRLDVAKKRLEELVPVLREFGSTIEETLVSDRRSLTYEQSAIGVLLGEVDSLDARLTAAREGITNSFQTIREFVDAWGDLSKLEPMSFTGGTPEPSPTMESQLKMTEELNKYLENLEKLSPDARARLASTASARLSQFIQDEDYEGMFEFFAGINQAADRGQIAQAADTVVFALEEEQRIADAAAAATAHALHKPELDAINNDIEDIMNKRRALRDFLGEPANKNAEPIVVEFPFEIEDTTFAQEKFERLKRLSEEVASYKPPQSTLVDEGATPTLPWQGQGWSPFVGDVPFETFTIDSLDAKIGELRVKHEELIGAIEQTSQGAGDAISPLSQAYSEVATQENAATEANEDLVNQLDKSNGDLKSHQSVVGDVTTIYNGWANEVTSLINLLDELNGKRVESEIAINVTGEGAGYVNIPNMVAGVSTPSNRNNRRRTTRASGGIVPDLGVRSPDAVGTDTVPAMLTPGEYVIRRDAVKKYGVSLFDKFNSMNMGGFFTSLVAQLPTVSHTSYTYNSTNNDNRQTSVNQYITTNNPDYSYRVASRFAYGLQ